MALIQGYTQTVLDPQLLSLGLNRHQREIVVEDETQRLEFPLAHWADLSYWRTVLVLDTEEASFWELRDASLEVRAFVVVTVRITKKRTRLRREYKSIIPNLKPR